MKNENIYRAERIRVGETQEGAAACLGVSSKTLSNYENREAAPPPEIIDKMCQVYQSNRLKEIYCDHVCILAKKRDAEICQKNIFQAGYGLLNIEESISEIKTKLFEILSDGIIDSDEKKTLQEMLPEINDIKNTISEIEREVQHVLEKS